MHVHPPLPSGVPAVLESVGHLKHNPFDKTKELVVGTHEQAPPLLVPTKVNPFMQLHFPLTIVPSKFGSMAEEHWKQAPLAVT